MYYLTTVASDKVVVLVYVTVSFLWLYFRTAVLLYCHDKNLIFGINSID